MDNKHVVKYLNIDEELVIGYDDSIFIKSLII